MHPVDDASCPAQFVLCLDTDGGLDFEHNLRAYREWTKEAWIRCAPLPVPGPVDGGTPGVDGGP